MTDKAIIDGVLRREGWPKYTNVPGDRGGPTKGGITLAEWQKYVGEPVDIEDLKAITEADARNFYWQKYVVAPNFHRIDDDRLRELLVDAGVNHGPRHPSKWLQAAIGVKQDGAIGPITLAEVTCRDPRGIYRRVLARRIRLYGRLVASDRELRRAAEAGFNLQAKFAAGWNNRAADFVEAAADW